MIKNSSYRLFELCPRQVKKVETKYRRIVTKLPPPRTVRTLEKLLRYEPRSVQGLSFVVWDRAEGFQVFDKCGNKWLDWSSGVLVTAVGHGRKEIKQAIMEQVNRNLLYSYCRSPVDIRAELVERLAHLSPEGLDKVFLLSTGSEAVEAAIKLARMWGQKLKEGKIKIVSFERAFHGRTLGAQMIGGIPSLKEWIGNLDPDMYQVPFPEELSENRSFDSFERALKKRNVRPEEIAAVISEAYQGNKISFLDREYVQELSRWCKRNQILLIFDEVQAGFGRTGKMFGFEHYRVIPDLICCGKGISASLPLSAVIGRDEIMNLPDPGTMSSTHAGHPVCVAAALANIEIIEKEKLIENAAKVGTFLREKLTKLCETFPNVILNVTGRGLVYGLHVTGNELALGIVRRAVEKGLLLLPPIGPTLRIAPPLIITKEAIEDGILALKEAITETREVILDTKTSLKDFQQPCSLDAL